MSKHSFLCLLLPALYFALASGAFTPAIVKPWYSASALQNGVQPGSTFIEARSTYRVPRSRALKSMCTPKMGIGIEGCSRYGARYGTRVQKIFGKCLVYLRKVTKNFFTRAGIWAAISGSVLFISSPPAVASSVADQYRSHHMKRNAEAAFRIVFASVLGSTLGLERSSTSKKDGTSAGAGLRTMALVSLGACVFTICGTHGFAATVAREAAKGPGASLPGIENASVDASRMSSTITTGVGFIGAGVITNNRMPDGTFDQESTKRGLTTAATIWVSAAVGAAAGAGMYFTSLAFVLSSLCVLGLGEWLGPVKKRVAEEKQRRANEGLTKAPPKEDTIDSPIAAIKSPSSATSNETTAVTSDTEPEIMAGSMATGTWTASLDEHVDTKSPEKQVYAKNETVPFVGEPFPEDNNITATKAPKSVDLYVERFIQKGGSVKGGKGAKKDLDNDDDIVDSQQVIW